MAIPIKTDSMCLQPHLDLAVAATSDQEVSPVRPTHARHAVVMEIGVFDPAQACFC